MVQRRLTDNFMNQNYFAPMLGFLIAVPGIFVAIQSDCWYQCRRCDL